MASIPNNNPPFHPAPLARPQLKLCRKCDHFVVADKEHDCEALMISDALEPASWSDFVNADLPSDLVTAVLKEAAKTVMESYERRVGLTSLLQQGGTIKYGDK